MGGPAVRRGAVGGAERLVGELALRATPDGWSSEVATTCAVDHYTWENALPAGEERVDGLVVSRFPVSGRDAARYAAAAPGDPGGRRRLPRRVRLALEQRLVGGAAAVPIVAEHVHPELADRVHRLDKTGKRVLADGKIVLRYAIYSKTAELALATPEQVAFCYHNITPGPTCKD